jgi:predicted DNA-binding protein
MQDQKVAFQVWLTQELSARLKFAAQAQGRSGANLVRLLIEREASAAEAKAAKKKKSTRSG